MNKVRSLQAVPRPAANADFKGISLSPQEGFLFSRIDGHTPSELLAQLVGMSATQVVDAVQRLWEVGLVEIDGAPRPKPAPKPAPVAKPAPAPTSAPRPRPTAVSRPTASPASKPARSGARSRLSRDMVPAGWPVQPKQVELSASERLDEDVVPYDDQVVVRCFAANLEKLTYYELFSVAADADRRAIRKAYFTLSKAFHPDHWFRRELGQFSEDVSRVFKWVNKGYAVVSSPAKREAYDRLLKTGVKGEWEVDGDQPAGQTRMPSRFEQLRAEGAKAESRRDFAAALRAFGEAVSIRSDGEVLLHMALCELQLGRPAHGIEILLARARGARASENACLLVEAHLSRREGRVDRARRLYQAVLDRDPSSRDAAEGLRALKS